MSEQSWDGDVYPTTPVFTTGSGADLDDNGFSDVLTPAGTFIYTADVSPSNPEGGVGDGLEWNAARIWRGYRVAQSIVVGKNLAGTLSFFGSGDPSRYCHLMIGENAGSFGQVTSSGFGAGFDNDWNFVPPAYLSALEQARPLDGPADWTWMYDHIHSGSPDPYVSPAPAHNYNLWVGCRGFGTLSITGGSKFRIRHRTFVGGYETVDDSESFVWPYEMLSGDQLATINKINSLGDISTFVDGEGGVVTISGVGSTLEVVGVVGGNVTEITVDTADGDFTIEESTPATAALPSIWGKKSYLNMSDGASLIFGQGAELRGVIVVEEGTSPCRISTPAGETTLTGVLILRSGAELILDGNFINDGIILIESRSVLVGAAEIGGSGVLLASKCGPTAVVAEAGEARYLPELTTEI